MADPTSTRRRVLRAAGTLALAGLAGCSSAGGSTEAPETSGESGATATDDGHHGEGNTHHEETTHGGGHDHEHGHGSLPDGPSASATVAMKTTDGDQHFDPHVVWVEEGGTVTWELVSGTHTATAYHPDNDRPRRVPEGAAAFDSGTLSEQGATFEHTFETAGVYDYFCLPHEGVGMLGTVIVGEPDAHGQPGLAEPQESLPETAREKIAALNEMGNKALGHTHGGETTESGGHDDEHGEGTDDGHHGGTTESGHHEGTDDGHHDGGTTEEGHHD